MGAGFKSMPGNMPLISRSSLAHLSVVSRPYVCAYYATPPPYGGGGQGGEALFLLFQQPVFHQVYLLQRDASVQQA